MATKKSEELKPWRQRRRSKEADIRKAAVHEFCRHGYAGASIQAIADALGMNKATLYHYVDSKERLLADILDYAHDVMIEIENKISALDATPVERLRAFLERHLVWYLNNLELAKVVFHEWTNLTGALLEAQRERRRAFDDYVRGLIRAGQADVTLRRDLNVTLATNFILGAINAVPSWYRKRGSRSARELARIYADYAITVLTCKPSRCAPGAAGGKGAP
jgi:AcrR family transcriptional regulator